MNVLLVDDEPIALRKLIRIVGRVLPGAELHGFELVSEAMEYAEQGVVDLAFLDIQMRGISGVTVAGKLIERYPKVNIVFCTGFNEYAMDAHDLFCSGYLMKPITEEQVRKVIQHLRYPIEEKSSDVLIQCYHGFEIYYKGEPVQFERGRTKELLAYLVVRNGAECSTAWLNAVMFEDKDHSAYIRKLRKDLVDTLTRLGISDVVRSEKGSLWLNTNAVTCDYFEYLDGRRGEPPEEFLLTYRVI